MDNAVTTHELKIISEYFMEVKSGKKPFEVRVNDRGFNVGDVLILKEWLPNEQKFSGREDVKIITYILDNEAYCKPGYVIMALKGIRQEEGCKFKGVNELLKKVDSEIEEARKLIPIMAMGMVVVRKLIVDAQKEGKK